MKVDESAFRTDLEDFFKLSGVLTSSNLKHTPFVVLLDEGITLCRSASELVKKYDGETRVLVQWRGQWSSDFFSMRVKDVAAAMARS